MVSCKLERDAQHAVYLNGRKQERGWIERSTKRLPLKLGLRSKGRLSLIRQAATTSCTEMQTPIPGVT